MRALLLLFLLVGCKETVAPEAHCTEKCTARAKCSERECSRGCAFILDRIVEREDDNVLACIANAKGACDDPAWADCAARIGVHADGGPGAPEPLPKDDTTTPSSDDTSLE